MQRDDLLKLAEHHERQGVIYASAARNDASWYHGHAIDTRRSADHFTVAASLRAIAEGME